MHWPQPLTCEPALELLDPEDAALELDELLGLSPLEPLDGELPLGWLLADELEEPDESLPELEVELLLDADEAEDALLPELADDADDADERDEPLEAEEPELPELSLDALDALEALELELPDESEEALLAEDGDDSLEPLLAEDPEERDDALLADDPEERDDPLDPLLALDVLLPELCELPLDRLEDEPLLALEETDDGLLWELDDAEELLELLDVLLFEEPLFELLLEAEALGRKVCGSLTCSVGVWVTCFQSRLMSTSYWSSRCSTSLCHW